MELGRPVSKLQSLFTRNCWLWTGSSVFFCQRSKRDSLRPVLESQSVFTRNCWLRIGSFLILLKMASDEDERPSDSFSERYRHSDLLYSRNDQHKTVDLHFFEKQHVEKYPLIDLLKFDYRM